MYTKVETVTAASYARGVCHLRVCPSPASRLLTRLGATPVAAIAAFAVLSLAQISPAQATPPVAESGPGEASAPVHPGPQATPPGPPVTAPAPLEPITNKRGHIRGCPVDSTCRVELEGLRAFERETFQRGGSPWLDDDDPMGHNAVRAGLPTRGAPSTATERVRPRKGTDVRPDLPWLDQLQLPDIPVYWDERVIKYLEFYKDDRRGRRIMSSWLRRQGRYKDLILGYLRKANLPESLLYIAMIESSYDPHEYSRVGASGLWQFMPAGGKIYGLTINRWLDERNDPVRSTEAAMMYFADLYQRFGDWHLALAAYNAGYGAVLWAVATFNSNNFWELVDYENALPFGSAIYVPKFLATAIVGENLEFFGYGDLAQDEAITWDHVTVPKSIKLSTIARAAGTTTETIKYLNPQLRRSRTPPQADYVLRIPGGATALFTERFAQLRADWDKYDAYVVAHGQRFEDIATLHGISRYKLAKLNDVDHQSEVRGGMLLVVPRISKDKKQANLEKAKSDLYTAGSPRSKPEDKLLVAVPDKDLTVKGKRRVFYRVVIGDTQYGVARAFGVARRDLAAWNDLDIQAHLHPRMVLQLFVDKGFSAKDRGIDLLESERLWVVTRGTPEHTAELERRRGRERFMYKAEKSESFEAIGKKYGLTARDIARVNRRSHRTVLQPGEEIVLYRVVDKDASKRAALQARKLAKTKRRSRKSKKSSKK